MSSVPTPAEAHPEPFRQVAVVGLGVMGGSLARALAVRHPACHCAGWSPSEPERAAALEAGVLASAHRTPEQAAEGADLVVLATPLNAVRDLVSRMAEAAEPTALITDVASLKVPVLAAARDAGLEARWVGSHPMCGSEASGFAASREGLFEGARVYLVADGAGEEKRALLWRWWESLGALPEVIDAEAHDDLMAAVSHLPQLAANALGRVLTELGLAPDLLGPGGRDMTRLASSSPQMWREILAEAPRGSVEHLRTFARHAGALADLLEAGEIDALATWMGNTRAWREGR
jgi:prephenate dehydrogenase